MQQPIVYVYQEDLLKMLDAGNDAVAGIAGEWKGEGVFHAFANYPKTNLFGCPLPCLFSHLPAETHDLQRLFNDDLVRVHTPPPKRALGVYFWITDGQLSAKCLLKEEDAVCETELKFVPGKSDLFSRAKGILELDILESQRILIIGLGSFGSHIAIEFAKAGIGHFALADYDRVELHNVARHTCGVNELGRLKTDAIRDAILLKNPYANVETLNVDITKAKELLDTEVAKADLVLCATDNNHSRGVIIKSVVKHGKVALFGRAYTRAEGGDIIRVRPGGPCYFCNIQDVKEEPDMRDLPAYSNRSEAVVQVGLSADIIPICNMMVKLGLVELSRGMKSSGLSELEHELSYDYYFWANRRETHYHRFAAFNEPRHMPKILKWYGGKMTKNSGCHYCGDGHGA